jgi:FixJ family two-component response regulator
MTIRQHTIAVVDDDPALRKALARLLTEHGYRVELFASGWDFLSAAATSEATCVVIDVHLGDASGLDLARQLSAFGLRLPTIFISGSDDESVRTQCVHLGCIAYLQKPFSDDRLIHAISMAIGSDRDV